jgi:hypothetical protein
MELVYIDLHCMQRNMILVVDACLPAALRMDAQSISIMRV